jgi:hypothetical protein
MNKVLKMNQDISQSVLNDGTMSQVRSRADDSVEASLALLRSLGKGKEIAELSENIAAKGKNHPLAVRPVLESWEDIVAQANLHEPNEVVLEDIMSEAEIQSAFAELDAIEEQFSRKTSIVNKVEARHVPPKKVADKSLKILKRRKPKQIYKINRNPLLLMLNLLPRRWQTGIIRLVLKEKKNGK